MPRRVRTWADDRSASASPPASEVKGDTLARVSDAEPRVARNRRPRRLRLRHRPGRSHAALPRAAADRATPPTDRFVLVNGFDAWVETPAGRFALSVAGLRPGRGHPDGVARASTASRSSPGRPGPTRSRTARDRAGAPRAQGRRGGGRCRGGSAREGAVALEVRPFLSGRDYHSLHHENPAFRFDADDAADGSRALPPVRGRPRGRFPVQRHLRRTPPIGTATSSTRRSAPAGSTSRRTSPRRACSASTSRRATPCCSWPPRDTRRPWRRSPEAAVEHATAAERRRRADFAEPARALRRRVPRAPRRGPDHRGRLPVVHRLGPRHVHRAARPVPGDRPARRGRADPASSGPGAVSEGMLPNFFPDADKRRSSTRSTRRSGI